MLVLRRSSSTARATSCSSRCIPHRCLPTVAGGSATTTSRSATPICASMASRRLTGNSPAGIALLRYSPTEFTELTEEVAESILPQISQIDTDRFFQGVHLSQVHQQSKKCNNRARSATTERVGALETSAPPESSICENLCNPWENIQQEGSVYSVNSVGEHTARRVQSVGEQT